MKNNLVELSQAISPDGRRRVRLALHTIHPDETECNLNGITYLEEYTRKNADSIIGMPICATFLDDVKDIPYDHGMTGNDDFVPLFEDSEQVGTADGWSIENIVIEGETKRVIIADGYINQQRYPNFVKWLENQRDLNIPIYGSIEFVGTKESKRIIYKDGKTAEDKFRVPVDFSYSGYCILSVKPSDSNAIMVELNQLNNNQIDKETSKKEEKLMDEKQIEKLVADVKATIIETNSKNSEYEVKLTELNSAIETKEKEIAELNEKLEESKKEIEEKDAKMAETNELVEKMKSELNECKKDNAINELNQALLKFTEEEKKYAETEINAFNEDYTKVEINSIVMKINATIGEKTKELQIAEINSAKEQPNIDDIFSGIDDVSSKEILDIDGIFA